MPAAMSNALRERLTEAIRTGEVLRIAYHGGSQPGAAREITPLAVTEDVVTAEDLATRQRRTFKLERIELLAPDAPVADYDPNAAPPPEDTRTVAEVVAAHRGELEGLGWHVDLGQDQIGLARFFKNGKPRKTPEVGLTFSPLTVDMFDDFDGRGLQTVERPSKRPYAVFSPGLSTTRTFTAIGRAAALFWEEARRHAPGEAPASRRS